MNSILEALHPTVQAQAIEPDAPALRLALAFLLDGLDAVRIRHAGVCAQALGDFERELDFNEWPELAPDTAALIERVHERLEFWTGTLCASTRYED